MKRLPIYFTLALLITLVFAFTGHYVLLKHQGFPPLGDLLLPSYCANFFLALGIFIALFVAKEKLKNALGFLFLVGSLLKFIVFFIVFYPVYRADGEIVRTEFAAFFVPYMIALILETYFASKMLNQVQDS